MKKRKPCFDDTAIAAAMLGNVRKPRTLDRSGRVELIGKVAEALVSDQTPSREAALFVGGALLAWLGQGGNLEKDFFKVVKPKSHLTPSAIWRNIAPHQDERQDGIRPVCCAQNHSKPSKKETLK